MKILQYTKNWDILISKTKILGYGKQGRFSEKKYHDIWNVKKVVISETEKHSYIWTIKLCEILNIKALCYLKHENLVISER